MRKFFSWLLIIAGYLLFAWGGILGGIIEIAYVAHEWGIIAGIAAFVLFPLTAIAVPIYLGVTAGIWKFTFFWIGIFGGVILRSIGSSIKSEEDFMGDLLKKREQK